MQWTEIDPEGPPMVYPWCDCEARGDAILSLDDGMVTLIHEACGMPLDVDTAEVSIDSMPVRVEFVDLGWTASTPSGPAEWEGGYFDVKPRR